MEGLVILLVILVVVAPLVMSIVALVFASLAKRRIAALEARLAEASPAAEPVPAAPPIPAPAPPAAELVLTKPEPSPTPPPVAVPPPVPPSAPKVRKSGPGLEVTLGGKVASFAGIAVLLVGIVFLVGYAIKNAWLGPGARVVLGLVCGGVLVVLGHLCETRGKGRLQLLARALTGGGAALFYFCVFAAYGIYDLIGPLPTGGALLVSAAATFGLSLVYRSQAVALVGLIGAFITPLLIGGDFDKGAFPLAYIAVINLPVILLGIRRNWQVLYNLAFVFTVAYMIGWMDWMRSREWILALVFSLVYFFEFAALGLLKLRGERRTAGRSIDLLRLALNSLMLMGALYWIFHDADQERWTGAVFLAAAVLHIGLVKLGWHWLPAYRQDTLGFLVGGLSFASLALPIQLDGAWVSAGWGLEGVILCWFALRNRSKLLLIGALLMGGIGLMKSLVFDFDLYTVTPELFLNGRFVSGLLCALFLGVQARLMRRARPTVQEGRLDHSGWVIPLSFLAVTLVAVCDGFWTLGANDAWGWLLTTSMLMVAVLFAVGMADRERTLMVPAIVLLCILPAKIILDWLAFVDMSGIGGRAFLHGIFLGELAMAALAVYLCTAAMSREPFRKLKGGVTLSAFLNIFSLVAFIAVVTFEFGRMSSDGGSTGITIWWAVCALSLAIFGLVKNTARHRYLALALFGMTLVKVFFVDLGDLKGLYRVGAFMGLGVLLLVLSFLYQRLSQRLAEMGDNEPSTG